MNYYRDTRTNDIYAYSKTESAETLHDDFSQLIQLTDEEVETFKSQNIDDQKTAENQEFLSLETRRASNAITVLDDAIEFEIATDEEIAQHKLLRKYRLDLSRVPNQQEWPLDPTWPECPDFFKI